MLPIHKGKDSLAHLTNYRPISLNSVLGKVYECMVNTHLVYELETRFCLAQHQYGFRKNRSTIDVLQHLQNRVQASFSRGNHILAIFFDLQKAFDTTWQLHIIEQLYDWRFRGRLPLAVKAYL